MPHPAMPTFQTPACGMEPGGLPASPTVQLNDFNYHQMVLVSMPLCPAQMARLAGGDRRMLCERTSPQPITDCEERQMRFGFFDQLPCASGFTEAQRYRDILAQIELGDEVGFDTVWLGELHFSRAFSILANPLMVLAAAAQRTRRIRLGTAVTLLPLHNPVKIAEDAATVDILSNGRLELGCGRGTAPLHYAGYDIPQEESRERFDEALDFIIGAWTNERFSYAGKHYRAKDLTVIPQPVQKPHPPVRIAANSPDTFPFAARRGFPIFATPLINPPDKLKEGLAVYRGTLPAGDTALAFPVHVTTSRAQARQDSEAGLMRFLREAAERLAPLGQADIKSFEAFRQVLARIERVTFDDMDREMGVFGDPDYCVDRVQALTPRLRHGRIHLLLQPGRDHGPRHGAPIDDPVRQGSDAALPLAGRLRLAPWPGSTRLSSHPFVAMSVRHGAVSIRGWTRQDVPDTKRGSAPCAITIAFFISC